MDTVAYNNAKQQFLLEFIDLYKSLPTLWKIKSKEYTDRTKKRKAYEVMVRKMREVDPEASRETVTKKINSIRSIYRKEKRKVIMSHMKSDDPDDYYTPSLWYYDLLDCFLGDITAKVIMFDDNNEDESRESKPKKPRHDNFTIVKKCCVNLVKKHGRSVTLFDDQAFRELIDLIPMTQSQKQTLTSEYIQKLLDNDQLGDADETMDKTTDDITADDDDDETPLQAIKGEIEPIPCTCGKDTDESMTRHAVECPASSQQTYWNFFEVSLDSATCQICNKTLTWTNITTLKEHLQNSHPSVDFVDDDEEFQKGPLSEDGSTNDFGMEEVYLDETVSESEQTASAAKRRRKRAKAALNITGPITRENIAVSLQRFKSLDSFGQYVASLMKLIPKDKCIKFQIQIVERLLQEQAAAG